MITTLSGLFLKHPENSCTKCDSTARKPTLGRLVLACGGSKKYETKKIGIQKSQKSCHASKVLSKMVVRPLGGMVHSGSKWLNPPEIDSVCLM